MPAEICQAPVVGQSLEMGGRPPSTASDSWPIRTTSAHSYRGAVRKIWASESCKETKFRDSDHIPGAEVHGCRRQRVWQAPVNLWEAPFCSVLFRLACRPTLQRYRSGHEWGANGSRFEHGGAQMGHVPRTEVRGAGPMT